MRNINFLFKKIQTYVRGIDSALNYELDIRGLTKFDLSLILVVSIGLLAHIIIIYVNICIIGFKLNLPMARIIWSFIFIFIIKPSAEERFKNWWKNEGGKQTYCDYKKKWLESKQAFFIEFEWVNLLANGGRVNLSSLAKRLVVIWELKDFKILWKKANRYVVYLVIWAISLYTFLCIWGILIKEIVYYYKM